LLAPDDLTSDPVLVVSLIGVSRSGSRRGGGGWWWVGRPRSGR